MPLLTLDTPTFWLFSFGEILLVLLFSVSVALIWQIVKLQVQIGAKTPLQPVPAYRDYDHYPINHLIVQNMGGVLGAESLGHITIKDDTVTIMALSDELLTSLNTSVDWASRVDIENYRQLHDWQVNKNYKLLHEWNFGCCQCGKRRPKDD